MSPTSVGRSLLAVIALALIGGALFGVWHLVVGGLIDGDPRAGTFGLVLAPAAAGPLIVGAWLMRRRRRDTLAA